MQTRKCDTFRINVQVYLGCVSSLEAKVRRHSDGEVIDNCHDVNVVKLQLIHSEAPTRRRILVGYEKAIPGTSRGCRRCHDSTNPFSRRHTSDTC